MTKKLQYLYLCLIFMIIFIWFVILSLPDDKLHIYACDVGQGDGFLITKGVDQIVIDGGPNNSISSCLGKHMPFWDREIEMVVLTHPDRDHYYGLINLINNYTVAAFVATPVKKEPAGDYQKLVDAVNKNDVKIINSYVGETIRVGDLSFDIDWPSREAFGEIEDKPSLNTKHILAEANLLGIMLTLKYNNFSELFTADLEFNNEPEALQTGKLTDVNVLKVPHHGSKNGLTEDLILVTHPQAAIISAGLNNQFDHPNGETIDLLDKYKIPIYRTDQMGEIEIVSDGEGYKVNP